MQRPALAALFCLSLAACAPRPLARLGAGALAEPRLALWVECQGEGHTLDAPERIDALLEDAHRWGADTLLVQVHRGGRAWWPSEITEPAPAVRQGYDPLGYLTGRARAQGIAVHAWLNVFNLAENGRAAILRKLGEGVLTRDNYGRSVGAYEGGRPPATWRREGGAPLIVKRGPAEPYLIGTPGLWLDPGVEAVQVFELAVLGELLAHYPDLAGVHLDFIRYPYALPLRPVSWLPVGLDFGYAPEALAAFHDQTGARAPLANEGRADASKWDTWRREQVTRFVRGARALTGEAGMSLSVAALAWADRAYLSAFQDWRGWMDEGLVGAVAVMNYSRDRRLARHITRAALAAAAFSDHAEAWIGLGAYLFEKDPEALLGQMVDARAAGARRIVLFSYDRIAKSPALRQMLEHRAAGARRRRKESEEIEDFFEDSYL